MQKSCYKIAGLSDVGVHIMIHASKKIIMIVLWIGVSLCSTDALAL